jgi:DNA-binding transcriptional MerR regulator/effector-binding domain-containing protein
MFSIGEFASLGRVSVRMLRHYDAIGLLRPAHVDEYSGYRFYEARQLQRLNRLIALKDLGFTLAQIKDIVDDAVEVAELRGMLRLRRAELADQIRADSDRLARVEARLRMIEREGAMSTQHVHVKSVEPVRVTTVSGFAKTTSHEDVGPVVQSLFGELMGALQGTGVRPSGPAVAAYSPTEEGGLEITVGCPVGQEVSELEVTVLPGVAEVASYLYCGAMAGIAEGYQMLATWIEDQGYRTDGTAREVYLVSHPEPEERWETELQMPITRS